MWLAGSDKKAATAEDFDAIYRVDRHRYCPEPDAGISQRRDEQLQLTGRLDGLRVLDLGGGPVLASAAVRAARYLLVDYSAEACRIVEEAFAPCRAVCDDAVTFAERNAEPFDITVCFGVLEYLPPDALSRIMASVSSPVLCLGAAAQGHYLRYGGRVTVYDHADYDAAAVRHGWVAKTRLRFASHAWARYEKVTN